MARLGGEAGPIVGKAVRDIMSGVSGENEK